MASPSLSLAHRMGEGGQRPGEGMREVVSHSATQRKSSATRWSSAVRMFPAPSSGRYGGADSPEVDPWNREGLPASPFSTDNFQMITAPK